MLRTTQSCPSDTLFSGQQLLESFGKWVKDYEIKGGLNLPVSPTKAVQQLRREGEKWLQLCRAALPSMPPSLALECLEAYDFVHRLCKGEAPSRFIWQNRTRIADQWAAGDRNLTETQFTLLLWQLIECDIDHVAPAYIQYFFATEESWINQLRQYGTFPNLSPEDTYRRLNHLLRQKLHAYFGSESEQAVNKQKWASAHLLSDISHLTPSTLHSCIPFAREAQYWK